MTYTQKKFYRALYEGNIGYLMGSGKDRPRLGNLSMQLRKCCDHVFLLNGMEKRLLETG